jgi:hypothetical protein
MRDFYRKHMGRSRLASHSLEIGTLVAAGGTTLAAAVHARTAITASIAAFALVLTGTRQYLSKHDDWLRFSLAWIGIKRLLDDYELTPSSSRSADDPQRLMDAVNAIVDEETRTWNATRAMKSSGQHDQ